MTVHNSLSLFYVNSLKVAENFCNKIVTNGLRRYISQDRQANIIKYVFPNKLVATK